MIERIYLQFGASSTSSPLEFNPGAATIFVGPNNSGKSRALIEIERYCRRGKITDSFHRIISKIEFKKLSEEELALILSRLVMENVEWTSTQRETYVSKLYNGTQIERKAISLTNLRARVSEAHIGDHDFNALLDLFTIRLDGTRRLNLLNPVPTSDLKSVAGSVLMELFQKDHLREEVRRIVFDAIEKYLVIDPTSFQQLQARFSDVAPQDEREEKSWETASVEFHKKALSIEQMSDGIKAFTGIISTIVAGDPIVTLIDEPEAFLHPSLAFKLGKEVSLHTKKKQSNLFISTHSASFLMGCMQSGVAVNVVRLTYKDGMPTARLLPQEKLVSLMRHPLLRSTGIVNGLFYEAVIVTEGDPDRAFYNEINERLLAANDPRGIPNCLFVNAQNWQTIREIIKPMREIGIPAAAIGDVDVLKGEGQNWTRLLNAALIPESTIQAMSTLRSHVFKTLEAKGDYKRIGGVNVLDGHERAACIDLFEQLEKYGLFLVRKGELESWLSDLGINTGHGPSWLISMFERLGEDQESPDYVKPNDGDVWDFIGSIKKWLDNPNKNGL